MKRFGKLSLIGGVATLSLVLSACGGSQSSGAEGRFINVYSEKVSDPLVPTATAHYSGSRIVNMLFSGLTYLDAAGVVHNEVAKSITSTDNKLWTIKLRQDSKFTNEEAVTAKSFIDAWNYGAKESNAQGNFDHYSGIVGSGGNQDALSGLKQINDYEFTVELKSPTRDFPAQLSGRSFLPMPSVAFKDMQAFGQHPIGNGPYEFVSWQKLVKVELKKNPNYTGPRKAENSGLVFKIYSQPGAAYSDLLSGGLDVQTSLPVSVLPNYKHDLGDRWSITPGGFLQTLVIPYTTPGFSGQEGIDRRQALSMAINRPEIAEKIFDKTRTPATQFIPSMIEGYNPNQPGTFVTQYDPQKAKELWAKANAISPWGDRQLKLFYNSDGPYKEMFEALANSISNILGIKSVASAQPNFSSMKSAAMSEKQPVRLGWFADYPQPPAWWRYMFLKDGSGNWSGFDNAEFAKDLAAGEAAKDQGAAFADYTKAQTIVLEQLPNLPLFFRNTLTAWSDHIQKPEVQWDEAPVYYKLKLK